MTDLEISKALALAIGWPKAETFTWGTMVSLGGPQSPWRDFDYRDWSVIGPVAARYNCFPMRGLTDAFWHSCCVTGEGSVNVYADTPQKAIAMAASKHHKARK